MSERPIINPLLPGGEVGPTITERAYLDQYGNLKAIGQNKFGDIDFNYEMATRRNKAYYNNSVEVRQYGLYSFHGNFLISGNKGDTIEIKRDKTDGIIKATPFDRGGKYELHDPILLEIYKLAEEKYKPYDFA